MPDIQRGGKFRPGITVLVLLVGLGAGWWLGRQESRRSAGSRPEAPATPSTRPVDIRIDPSQVRLVDTTLELKPMPSAPTPPGPDDDRKP